MKAFCIPKYLAESLKEAAQAGEINIRELYDMTSGERRALFEKYTDKSTAQSINAGFEEAMLSAQKDALKNWAENTFVGNKKSKKYADVLSKIEQLETLGVLDGQGKQDFLEDLVSTRLGATITKQELEKLNQFSIELESLQKLNDESKYGVSLEYLMKRKELNNYIESITPTKNLKIATGVIGKGFMLASPKTGLLNIQSNTLAGVLEAITRRISSGQYLGKNNAEMMDYIKFATKVYRKTGFDITRTMDLQYTPKVLGESTISTQGKGVVRKTGRLVEDVIFNKMLGLPDVTFSAFHYADTVNNMSALKARSEGLKGEQLKERATELANDAFRVDPQTEDGGKIKQKAIENAAKATYQNDSTFAKIAMGARTLLNDATGDLRIGDLIVPFVKTPANVLDLAFDYSAGGVIKGALNLRDAYKAKQLGDAEGFRDSTLKAKEFFVRAGLGLTLAFLIASMIDPDDDEYIGAYPTNQNERELFKLRNAVENSIKIGDKYISIDYLGALGVPVKGYLDAKKSGDKLPDKALGFLAGSLEQIKTTPGLEETTDTLDSLGVFIDNIKKGKNKANENRAINSIIDIVTARSIPAFVNDINKIIDPVRRDVDYESPSDKLKSKIPGLSKQLPEKVDTFGEVQMQEKPLSIVLFGSRIKTKKQGEVIDEITRLNTEGLVPTLGDFENSDRVKSMRGQLTPEKYKEMVKDFQTSLKDGWYETINSDTYKKASNDNKKALLDDYRADLRDDILKKYGYKKPKK